MMDRMTDEAWARKVAMLPVDEDPVGLGQVIAEGDRARSSEEKLRAQVGKLREALEAEHAWFKQAVNEAYYAEPRYVAAIRHLVEAALEKP